MDKEFVVPDHIVLRVALDWRESRPSLARLTSLRAVADVLAQFPRLAAGTVFLLYGRAHSLVLPHPANPDQGTQWIPKLSGGGTLKFVLARVDEPAQRVIHRLRQCRRTTPSNAPAPPCGCRSESREVPAARASDGAIVVIPTIACFGRRGRQVWTGFLTPADDAGGQESAQSTRSPEPQ